MKNIIGKITDGFAESTRAVHTINKENMAAVKADSKAFFEETTAPNPGFERFKQAKGFGNKVAVVVDCIKEGAKENSEKEKERREEIMGFGSYRMLFEEQREWHRKMIKCKY